MMPDLRLVPAATCDCCEKTAEVAEVELTAPVEAACAVVALCEECVREILERLGEKGDGIYG